jgi:hypothetical protein
MFELSDMMSGGRHASIAVQLGRVHHQKRLLHFRLLHANLALEDTTSFR